MTTTPLIRAICADLDAPNEVLIDAIQDESIQVAVTYIILGTAGEYPQERQWIAGAYLDKKAAEDARDALNKWCADNGANIGVPPTKPGPMYGYIDCPLDADIDYSFDGVRYSIVETPIKG